MNIKEGTKKLINFITNDMVLRFIAIIIIFMMVFIIISIRVNINKDNYVDNSTIESELKYYKEYSQDLEKCLGILLDLYKKLKIVEVDISCYTNNVNECDKDPNTTAINERPIPGRTCAVSRDLMYMLGKKIYIEGLGVFKVNGEIRANDLMNKRYSKTIDICGPSKKWCKKFGRKKKWKVVVLN